MHGTHRELPTADGLRVHRLPFRTYDVPSLPAIGARRWQSTIFSSARCGRMPWWYHFSLLTMLTLETYQDFLVSHTINGVAVRFLVANEQPLDVARRKILSCIPYLTSMPRQHLAAAFPIILIKTTLPSSGHGGGTPSEAGVEALIRNRTADIGASTEVMRTLITTANAMLTRSSFHWIPIHVYENDARLPVTVAHEVTHGIDMNLQLCWRRQITPELAASTHVARAATRPFNGTDLPASLPSQACHSGVLAARLSVNAYVSMISGFPGVGGSDRRQIIASLRLSKAFMQVPESWWEPYAE